MSNADERTWRRSTYVNWTNTSTKILRPHPKTIFFSQPYESFLKRNFKRSRTLRIKKFNLNACNKSKENKHVLIQKKKRIEYSENHKQERQKEKVDD